MPMSHLHPPKTSDATAEIKPNYSLQNEYENGGKIDRKNPEVQSAPRLILTQS
jgi:hypothetical protein